LSDIPHIRWRLHFRSVTSGKPYKINPGFNDPGFLLTCNPLMKRVPGGSKSMVKRLKTTAAKAPANVKKQMNAAGVAVRDPSLTVQAKASKAGVLQLL